LATSELDLVVMKTATTDIQQKVEDSTVKGLEDEEGKEVLSDYFNSVQDLISYTSVLQQKYDGLLQIVREVTQDVG